MQKLLTIWWIKNLEIKESREDRPIWHKLVEDILADKAEGQHQFLDRFWTQKWCARPKPLPPSVKHFWNWYISQRKEKDPETRAEVEGINFWYDPTFLALGRAAPRWGEGVWKDFYEGKTLGQPVMYLGELEAVARGITLAPPRFRNAANRLSDKVLLGSL